jgi:hypothetical protein
MPSMGDTTANSLNKVLQLAGVDPSNLTVLSCEKDFCDVNVNGGGTEERPEIITSSPNMKENFFLLINRWLDLKKDWMKNKGPNPSSLFRDISNHSALIDLDSDPEVDGVLYRSREGWKLKLEAAYQAEGLRWKDLGLQASPKEFAKKLPAFEVQEDPSAPEIFGLFHKVTLAGHPEVTIPWTDPYLLMEWKGFLEKAGVEKGYDETKKMSIYSTTVGGSSVKIMEEEWRGDEVKYRFFNPLGKLEREIAYKIPAKPSVTVFSPNNPEKEPYQVSVYGRKIAVWDYIPDNWASIIFSFRKSILEGISEALQNIPESMIAPILDGVGPEKPLRIILATQDKARELGFVGKDEWRPGGYSRNHNTFWYEADTDFREVDFLHDIGGHAYDDVWVPDKGWQGLTDPGQSALRDYYAWKLAQLFTPKELATYDRLSTQFRHWVHKKEKDPKEDERLEKPLTPFREKAVKRFVSEYAIEGSEGIRYHLNRPVEDFAEVMQTFFTYLNGRRSLDMSTHGSTKDWDTYRSQEPLLTLVGMDYLFHQYKVSKIGNIRREEVYSKKAFKEVLGIDLDKINNEEAYRAAGIPLDADSRPGFTFPMTAGAQVFSQATGDRTATSVGPTLSVRAGYRGKKIGGGVSLDYSHQSSHSLDSGLWGQAYWDLTALNSGTLRGITFFTGPAVGVRKNLSGDEATSVWAGADVGIGIFGGAISLVGEGKVNVSDLGQWKSLGVGLQFEPNH